MIYMVHSHEQVYLWFLLPHLHLLLYLHHCYLDKKSYERDCLFGSLQDMIQQAEKFYHHSVSVQNNRLLYSRKIW